MYMHVYLLTYMCICTRKLGLKVNKLNLHGRHLNFLNLHNRMQE